ncbi:MAG: DNA polymerase III subunit alpha [Gammaproteobacteria bacterium]|nr:DNA polymerase III subunit alpha [Gammaproteobacteria bacterium]MBQ0839825.1 DNA polymerase III subunit alpha [Gammaproteobacteria bacterium]
MSEQAPAPLPPQAPAFIHLHLHSEYSIADSTIGIKSLIGKVRELDMPAVAVGDICNFFALVKFYKAAQGGGIKPICGSDLTIAGDKPDDPQSQITLLVQNKVGYQNLTQLISRAYLEGQVHGLPCIRRSWLQEFGDGLIVLCGNKSDIGVALATGRDKQAQRLLQDWMGDFPASVYLELVRCKRPGEESFVHSAVALAQQLDCPVVASNDVRFISQDQFEAHEARVCIVEGRTLDDPRRERRYSDQQYLKSVSEMQSLFADIPEALENTVEIAKRCNLTLTLGKPQLPEYPIPEGMTTEAYFRQLSEQGLSRRLESITLKPEVGQSLQDYSDRLDFELNIINQMGFPGYFLIVMDFIRWAKEHDIPVGPGRGSGAGSLVAYALEITDLDPLEYDLLFERFLNPERVSMPDFDIDFCMDNRDRVIAYVADRYGRKAVSQIITFGTMAAKAVVRDVARAQGKSYGLADRLSKMIPFEIGITLQKAFDQEEILRDFLEQDEEAQEIWEMALQLEGLTRNVGKHAGGVVIAPTQLTDFSALYCDESGEGLVTQYDKDDVEDVGLVKFDFLGLRTLTIIDWALDNANVQNERDGKPPVVIKDIPLDDPGSYQLLQRAETTAVFQLESRGMKDLIKRQLPSRFEDIIALVALFRPGPLQSGMVDDFINRKHGRQEVAYPHPKYQHPDLKPVLEPTYGVILYQEQVMQIAQVLGGYTLGEADMLRRAMGKKKAEEMARQRQLFVDGAANNNVSNELAENIFDLMEKFAGYGFNKSHSAAYALLAYQTAWLKVHYPAAFMAAVLSADMQNTDKVVTLIDECRAMKLVVTPPDVNIGQFQFSVSLESAVVYGLGAIKGLGEGPVASILEARSSGGPFKDLFDFCTRIDARKVNKRALEALIRSGALDKIGPNDDPGYSRAVMLAAMEEAVKLADQHSKNAASGMVDLFGATPAESAPEIGYSAFTQVRRFRLRDRLQGEWDTLGLYLTGHPIEEYVGELSHFISCRLKALQPSRSVQIVAGLVLDIRTIKTSRGVMGVMTIDDDSARIDVTIFSEQYNACRDNISKGTMVVVNGVLSEDEYTGGLKMRAQQVRTLIEARQAMLKGLSIDLSGSTMTLATVDNLEQLLKPYNSGQCSVKVKYRCRGAEGEFALGEKWAIQPEDDLLHHLRDSFGAGNLQLLY